VRYKKPKCICGGKIIAVTEQTFEEYRNINTRGTINKRTYILNKDVGVSGANWLECFVCGKEFDIQYDDKGRFILGDER
jgi:hypothetical protein